MLKIPSVALLTKPLTAKQWELLLEEWSSISQDLMKWATPSSLDEQMHLEMGKPVSSLGVLEFKSFSSELSLGTKGIAGRMNGRGDFVALKDGPGGRIGTSTANHTGSFWLIPRAGGWIYGMFSCRVYTTLHDDADGRRRLEKHVIERATVEIVGQTKCISDIRPMLTATTIRPVHILQRMANQIEEWSGRAKERSDRLQELVAQIGFERDGVWKHAEELEWEKAGK